MVAYIKTRGVTSKKAKKIEEKKKIWSRPSPIRALSARHVLSEALSSRVVMCVERAIGAKCA